MPEIHRLHRVSLAAPGEFLFVALADAVPGMSRGQARQAVLAGLVKVDGAVVTTPKHVLDDRPHAIEADLRQGIERALRERGHGREPAAPRPFSVLYEDRHVLVVDKAAGILSAPMGHIDGEAPERGHVPELLRRMGRRRGRELRFIGVVHRLDRQTSGCLAFALTGEAQRVLAAQFAGHFAGRTYRCLTDGAPSRDELTLTGVISFGPDGRRCFRLDAAAGDRLAERARARAGESSGEAEGDVRSGRREGPGRDAITHVKVLRRLRRGAELEVTLETGRTHQIRVSLLAIRCPVSGDPVYFERDRGGGRHASPLRPPRMMLHAHTLSFDHPATGRRIEVVAALPEEFTAHARRMDT